MNAAVKAAICRPQSCFALLKTAFFHSTPVLERKRRSSSSSSKSSNNKKKRSKKFLKEHQEKIRRAVEELKREREEAAKKAKEAKENRNNDKHGSKSTRKRQFGDDDKDFDFVFRSLFGVSRGFDYSAYEEEERRWWYNPSWFSDHSRNSWRSKYRFYDKEEEEEEEEKKEEEAKEEEEDGYGSSKSSGSASDPIQASHRQTLGLSPCAPLKLEDVKHAYRTCALKWHPDRHDDSTKVRKPAEAEAKFKLCTVAYQSLIEKLQSTKIF